MPPNVWELMRLCAGNYVHVAPHISTGAINSSAGSIPRLVDALVDAIRSGTMEMKERAVESEAGLECRDADLE